MSRTTGVRACGKGEDGDDRQGGAEVDAKNPSGAGADRRQEIEAAIARFRCIKGEPAPPYQMQPGGIAARAMALAKPPRPLAVLERL